MSRCRQRIGQTIIGNNDCPQKSEICARTRANGEIAFESRLIVTSATTTSIVVTVPDALNGGYISVTVNGLTGYSPTKFTWTFQNVKALDRASYDTPIDLPVSASLNCVKSADLDNDGKIDFIVVNSSVGSIAVYRNISDDILFSSAHFASKVDYTFFQA